jgi:hypothetical protein
VLSLLNPFGYTEKIPLLIKEREIEKEKERAYPRLYQGTLRGAALAHLLGLAILCL